MVSNAAVIPTEGRECAADLSLLPTVGSTSYKHEKGFKMHGGGYNIQETKEVGGAILVTERDRPQA